MANQYCTNCGAPLGEGYEFCTNCGKPADPAAPAGNQATAIPPQGQPAPSQPAQAQAQPQGQPIPPQGQPMPPQGQPAQPQSQPMPGQPAPAPGTQAQQGGSKTALIVGIVAGAVALVAIIALLCVFVIMPMMGDKSDSSPSASSVTSASSKASGSSSSSSMSAEAQEYGRQLQSIYDQMAGIDSRISACASEFNQNYLNPSMSVRQGYANTAKAVENDVIVLQTTESAIRVSQSFGGAYATEAQHVRELLNDLYNRIHVINQSWDNSLKYSDPRGHQDAIIAPIMADNVNGDNKYFTHFKEYYPKWKFTAQ